MGNEKQPNLIRAGGWERKRRGGGTAETWSMGLAASACGVAVVLLLVWVPEKNKGEGG